MKNSKRLICLILCATLLIGGCIFAIPAIAGVTDRSVQPSNAWLSDVYIRESSADLVKNTLIPDMNSYTKSPDAFRQEVESLRALIDVDFATLNMVYVEIIKKAFEFIDDIGIQADQSEMKDYLQTQWKIVFPQTPAATESMYTLIVYACLKYDLLYPVVGIHFTVPENTSLDRTVVLLTAALLSDTVGDDVETLEEYAILNIKRSLANNGYILSESVDLSDNELLLLYKIMMAEQQGYTIENKNIANYSDADIEHVNNSYAAAVIKFRYDVALTPQQAGSAAGDENPDALPIAILHAMIFNVGGTVEDGETLTQLLKKACSLGCFKLDDEFYSDVFCYDVYLTYDCKEIWVTPFAYAAELGDDKLEHLSISLDGKTVKNASSTKVLLSGDISTLVIDLSYDDGNVKDSAKYTFTIYNGAKALPVVETLTPSAPSYSGDYRVPDLLSARVEQYSSGVVGLMSPRVIALSPFEISSGSAFWSTSVSSKPQNSSSAQNEVALAHINVSGAQAADGASTWMSVVSVFAVLILVVALLLLVTNKYRANSKAATVKSR